MIDDLVKKYPWPTTKPNVLAVEKGWFSGHEFYKKRLDQSIKILVELGSWLGKSTRFFLNQCPNAIVIAVDHWKGSKEHQQRFRALLPNLYNTFLVNCWEYRHRLVPLRKSTIAGLLEVAKFDIKPQFIYVDAGHSYEEVVNDISKSLELFPDATIGGDDWLWGRNKPVQKAVKFCAEHFGKRIDASNNNWIFR